MRVQQISLNDPDKFAGVLGDDLSDYVGRPGFRAIAALDDDNKPKGTMLWKVSVSAMDETQVASTVRWLDASDQETAAALFEEYESWCEDDGIITENLEIPVRGNDFLTEFFEKKGYEIKRAEGYEKIASMEDLKDLKKRMDVRVENECIYSLGDITEAEFREGLLNCIKQTKRNYYDDLPEVSYEIYDPTVSCCMVKNGVIEGFLLIRRLSSKLAVVELIEEVGEGGMEKKQDMAVFAAGAALRQYEDDALFILKCRDKDTRNLSRILLPKLKGEDVLRGSKTGA